jgi:hypothetical protein
MSLMRFKEDAEEGVVVGGPAEHFHAADGAIERVIDEAAGSDARVAGHGRSIAADVEKTSPVPVLFPGFIPSGKKLAPSRFFSGQVFIDVAGGEIAK